MTTKISISITPTSEPQPPAVFVLAVTDAPKNYDGFGTITLRELGYPLEDSDLRTKHNARLVLIREEHLGWHQGRYGSGLYCCHTDNVGDAFRDRDVADVLFKRLSHASPEE